MKEGSYVEEAKKLQLEFKPDPGDDRFLLEESGLEVEGGSGSGKGVTLTERIRPKTPKGFLP